MPPTQNPGTSKKSVDQLTQPEMEQEIKELIDNKMKVADHGDFETSQFYRTIVDTLTGIKVGTGRQLKLYGKSQLGRLKEPKADAPRIQQVAWRKLTRDQKKEDMPEVDDTKYKKEDKFGLVLEKDAKKYDTKIEKQEQQLRWISSHAYNWLIENKHKPVEVQAMFDGENILICENKTANTKKLEQQWKDQLAKELEFGQFDLDDDSDTSSLSGMDTDDDDDDNAMDTGSGSESSETGDSDDNGSGSGSDSDSSTGSASGGDPIDDADIMDVDDLMKKIKGNSFAEKRARRHLLKLKFEDGEVMEAFRKKKFKFVKSGTPNMHAEIRLSEHWLNDPSSKNATVAGIKRPCLVCYSRLEQIKDEAKKKGKSLNHKPRPGLFWPSEASLEGIPEGAARKLLDYVSQFRPLYLTKIEKGRHKDQFGFDTETDESRSESELKREVKKGVEKRKKAREKLKAELDGKTKRRIQKRKATRSLSGDEGSDSDSGPDSEPDSDASTSTARKKITKKKRLKIDKRDT